MPPLSPSSSVKPNSFDSNCKYTGSPIQSFIMDWLGFLPVLFKLFLDRFGSQVPGHKVVHGIGKILELSRIHVRASG